MKCKNHREEEAKYICNKCKMPICEECATEIRGNKVCINCIENAVYAEKDSVERKGFWNSLLFFMFACIPGAAHMYMALFKRGMQLMLTFFGAIVLVSYANIESFFPLFVIPTWFFSFFDAYNTRRKMLSGENVEDIEAYNYQFLIKNKKLLGIILIIVGAIGMLNSISGVVETTALRFGFNTYDIYWAIKRGVMPFILVLGGVFLLFSMKKANKEIEQ